ncbi:MAG TPA: PQQ-binding-like beta-propeller repeat protein [Candidatus Limnocylindria bacterium]|jgi:outer membrane protein assembly factor BamB|nr:PQQ-binding-like beta-propeller repeat protein [Candidatus Limnocylindria bacterium]
MRGIAAFALGVVMGTVRLWGADAPQWGVAWTRNQVSDEKRLPVEFNTGPQGNLRWSVDLGTETYSTPVIAHGRVLIGTNNHHPRNTNHLADSGVMMCFDEKDGRFLWQMVVPKRIEDPFYDWPNTGMSSPATVEGRRVYTVTNRGEVACLDLNGLADGNDGPFTGEAQHMVQPGTVAGSLDATDADFVWLLDLVAAAGIWTHDGIHCSVLIDGDFLYINTGTGVDNTHKVIRAPDAPSLVVVEKRTGRLLARDNEHIAPDIFHCTWSSPSLAKVDGKPLLFFAGGNGRLFAFEPLKKAPPVGEVATLKKVWQLDFDPGAPKTDIHKYLSNKKESPSNIYGMLVFDHGSLYVAGGGDWFWGKNEAWLKRIDPHGSGDITATHIQWSAPLGRHTMSTPAVADGLVYVADSQHFLRCIEAESGKEVWAHDVGGEVWASATVADGKVYLGTRNGQFWALQAGREKRVLGHADLGGAISSTAIAANQTLYVATNSRLFAFRK